MDGAHPSQSAPPPAPHTFVFVRVFVLVAVTVFDLETASEAEAAGVRKSALTGITVGTFLAVLFTVYGTCLLWGAQLVIWDRSNVACYNPTTIGCFTGGTVMQGG